MSTVIQPKPTDRAEALSVESHRLTAILDDRYALQWPHCVVCLWFVTAFLFVSHAPLFHSEVWRHAVAGRAILQTGTIPDGPLQVPLADGMPFLNSGWLSQWIMGQTIATWGVGGLSSLSAIVAGASLLLWAHTFFQRSGQKRFMLAGVSLMFWLSLTEMTAPQPLLLGGLCLAALVWLLAPLLFETRSISQTRLGWRQVGVVVVMLAWANLDGSFVYGWAGLLAITTGLFFTEWYHQRAASGLQLRFLQSVRSRELQGWIWTSEFALLATFLNPHGPRIWSVALGQGGHFPIWAEAGGQLPLVLASAHGFAFALVVGCVVVCWQQSRLKVSFAEVFVALAAGCLASWSIRFLPWFVGTALLVAARHYRDLAEQRGWLERPDSHNRATPVEASEANDEPRPLKFAYTLIAALIVWCGFALSPMSAPLLGGQQRSPTTWHHQATPVAVAKHLRQHGSDNLVWAPSYWADWLIYDGGAGIQLYTDSHIHQLPGMVQRDYSQIFLGGNDWQRITDRYAIHTLVIDKRQQPRMASEVMRSGGKWRLAFENKDALVLHRVGI